MWRPWFEWSCSRGEVGVTQEQARRLEERALARLSADGTLDAWRDAA